MVEGIKVLNTKLQFDPLGNRGGFGKSDIEIDQTRTTEYISREAISPVTRIIHWVDLRETGVRSSKVGAILQWNIRKAIGIEDEVARNGSRRRFANRACGIGPVRNLLDGPLVPGIERLNGGHDSGVGKIGISGARRTRIGRVGSEGKLGWNVEGKPGSPSDDGVEAPALGEALRPRGPHLIERQIPSSAEAYPVS